MINFCLVFVYDTDDGVLNLTFEVEAASHFDALCQFMLNPAYARMISKRGFYSSLAVLEV